MELLAESDIHLYAFYALQGTVNCHMRAVAVDMKGDTLYTTFYFDRKPTDKDIEDADDFEGYICADYPQITNIETIREFSDASIRDMTTNIRGRIVYLHNFFPDPDDLSDKLELAAVRAQRGQRMPANLRTISYDFIDHGDNTVPFPMRMQAVFDAEPTETERNRLTCFAQQAAEVSQHLELTDTEFIVSDKSLSEIERLPIVTYERPE